MKGTAGKSHPAASLLSVGFEGRKLNQSLKELLDCGVGGVILFSRNIGDAKDVAELIFEIKSYAGRPLFIGLDQEGGRVQRLREGFSKLPTMRTLGQHGSTELAIKLGRLIGRELRAVGVDLNYAPVLDVDTNPNNPVIGERSFSRDPELAARLGVAFAQSMENEGVASCGKHFPGHGDTHQDSHFQLPSLEHGRTRLDAVELLPFVAWSKAGLASLMSAHVVLKALDPRYPATMSPIVLNGILRQQLGFKGLIVSDDMEMKAIADHFGYPEAAIRGINAGVDHFLICHRHDVAQLFMESIETGLRKGEISDARFSDALKRVGEFTRRWARPAEAARLECLNTTEAKALLSIISAEDAAESVGSDPTEVMVEIVRTTPGQS